MTPRAIDLLALSASATGAAPDRRRLREHRRARSLALGPCMRLVFEDELTLRHQISEALCASAEQTSAADAAWREADTYAYLAPDGKGWKASLAIELAEAGRRGRELPQLNEAVGRVYIDIARQTRLWACANDGLPEQHPSRPATTHFLRFAFAEWQREAVVGGATVHLGCAHDQYAFRRALPKPDVLLLSNALLLGLVRPLREALGVPILCTLQGEAPFLDALPEPHRAQAWRLAAEHAREVAGFLAVSRYTGEFMRARLALPAERVQVVHNGLDARAYAPAASFAGPPTLGFVARLHCDKGLGTLIEAFVRLKQRPEHAGLRLLAAGATLKGDWKHVAAWKARLAAAGLAESAEFHSNVDFATKLDVLRRSTIFSVPATYGESFGLYLLEAWAMGLPVVQPAHGAFPELLESTGGGLLCAPDDPEALARALHELLNDPARARALGEQGRRAVLERFSAQRMAREVERACRMAAPRAAVRALAR